MSHDCCKKCGVMEPKFNTEITIQCDKTDCPQVLRHKQIKEMLIDFERQYIKDSFRK